MMTGTFTIEAGLQHKSILLQLKTGAWSHGLTFKILDEAHSWLNHAYRIEVEGEDEMVRGYCSRVESAIDDYNKNST